MLAWLRQFFARVCGTQLCSWCSRRKGEVLVSDVSLGLPDDTGGLRRAWYCSPCFNELWNTNKPKLGGYWTGP